MYVMYFQTTLRYTCSITCETGYDASKSVTLTAVFESWNKVSGHVDAIPTERDPNIFSVRTVMEGLASCQLVLYVD